MIGIKLVACTGKGETAIKEYVAECELGISYKRMGMSKTQYRAAKLTSKVLPYTEEYFTNPYMIIVTMKKGIMENQGYIVIPKVEIMLKKLMSKYDAGLNDYSIEVF